MLSFFIFRFIDFKFPLRSRNIEYNVNSSYIIENVDLSTDKNYLKEIVREKILNNIPVHISGKVFPISEAALRGQWRRTIKKAGITNLRLHDLRHEATSRFFEKGLNIMEVSAITGHKDLKMLKRYTHLKAEDLALKLG